MQVIAYGNEVEIGTIRKMFAAINAKNANAGNAAL